MMNATLRHATLAACAMALAISFSAFPALAQSQSDAPPDSQQQAQNQPPPGADPQQGGPPQGAPPPDARYAQAPPPPAVPAPATLTLPSGTIIPVRVTQWLSSDQNHPGDSFSATLDQPLIANGWVVARRGQTVIGRVAVAEKAGHGKNNSQLGLELSELTIVDGQQLPVSTQLVQHSAPGPSQNRQVGAVAATTIIGAAIGAVAGGGTGAAIGAGAGAGAGVAGVMATRGRPTVVPSESLLTFQLQAPLEISTERSTVAFQPVTQRDYGRDQDAYAQQGPVRRYAAGPGYGYPYPYYYYGYPYVYPAFGFYGGYYGGYRFGGGRFGGFRR